MLFYCSTKIEDYYKVGVADTFISLRNRFHTYSTIYPKISIKFFSEIGNLHDDIEYSFKNKFRSFRVKNSECYKLKFALIYKHFLKFQHKNKNLHHFWSLNDELYLSDYYVKKNYFLNRTLRLNSFKFEKNYIWHQYLIPDFLPVAKLYYEPSKKKNFFLCTIKYLNFEKNNFAEYKKKYSEFYNKKFNILNIERERDNFFSENFYKQIKLNDTIENCRKKTVEIIFDELNNIQALKKYPQDKLEKEYYEQSEQKSITNNPKKAKKIYALLRETYLSEEFRDLRDIFPEKKENFLQVLHRILDLSEEIVPQKLKNKILDLKEDIDKLIKFYSEREERSRKKIKISKFKIIEGSKK